MRIMSNVNLKGYSVKSNSTVTLMIEWFGSVTSSFNTIAKLLAVAYDKTQSIYSPNATQVLPLMTLWITVVPRLIFD